MEILAFDFGGTRDAAAWRGPTARTDVRRWRAHRKTTAHAGWRDCWTLAAPSSAIRNNSAAWEFLLAVRFRRTDAWSPLHVAGWEKVDLPGEMRKAFNLPVNIENDANAGALGEHRLAQAAARDTWRTFK